MNVVVCGLNSYLGRASITYLQGGQYTLTGVVRDAELLKNRVPSAHNIDLLEIDVLQYKRAATHVQLQNISFAFYFTQIPDLSDPVGINYEILSLRNYIQFVQDNGCNRIIYVGRSYERSMVERVRMLFEEFNVVYSIVVKDVAIGKGTAFDQYMDKMMKHSYIFLYKPKSTLYMRPILFEDLFRWIQQIDWQHEYLNDVVEIGGENVIELSDLIGMYIEGKRYSLIIVKNKKIAGLLNKVLYNIDYDVYLEYIKELDTNHLIDNSKWQSKMDFEFSELNYKA